MRVLELWRYPVKSLSGETLTNALLDERGLVGDRLWSVRDPDGNNVEAVCHTAPEG